MTNKYTIVFSTSLVIKEMKSKATREYCTSSRMADVKTDYTKFWERCGVMGTLIY